MFLDTIKATFNREFWPIAGRFHIAALKDSELWQVATPLTDRPGVYIWCCEGRVVRVGRSFSNARGRALNHVRDNTGGTMAEFATMPEAMLVLYTVDRRDYHWVAALEIYLEDELDPEHRSKRTG